MKTIFLLLLVMAALAVSQLAYGQACAPQHQSQVTAVQPAGTTFIILVPVAGPPVQYQPVNVVHQYAPHYPSYYHRGGGYYGHRGYGYGYGGYGYGRRYGSTYHQKAVIVRNPHTGVAYMVSRKQLGRW